MAPDHGADVRHRPDARHQCPAAGRRLTRDDRRIGATPDHLVVQLYRFGGFAGEMGGGPVRIARGQIAICDLRRPLDVEAVSSETIGLSVPRHLLGGVDVAALPARLDPVREQLLAARMTALHLRLPTLAATELPAVTADLIAALRRLFDPSAATDVLEAGELDADLLTLAERVIAGDLASPDLSPAKIAERLRVSRATLYRVFTPVGGVMHRVWSLRLEAVRAAIEQPFERRTLSRVAAEYGFRTAAHLSRRFHARYGAAPRDWRAQKAALSEDDWQVGATRLQEWWRMLGHNGG